MNKLASIALRAIPGAFILNSGISKIGMPADASEGTQQFAATGIPAVKNLPADKFGSILGWTEAGLGAALLTPFVSNRVAGLGLTAFGSGLLSLYFADPDNRQDDGIRPTDQGTSLAKDSWLVAVGLGLFFAGDGSSKKDKNKDQDD